jgi:hypothetical protein
MRQDGKLSTNPTRRRNDAVVILDLRDVERLLQIVVLTTAAFPLRAHPQLGVLVLERDVLRFQFVVRPKPSKSHRGLDRVVDTFWIGRTTSCAAAPNRSRRSRARRAR